MNKNIPQIQNPIPPPPKTAEGKAWEKYTIGLMDTHLEYLKEIRTLKNTLFWCYIMLFIGYGLFFAAMHFWGESLNK